MFVGMKNSGTQMTKPRICGMPSDTFFVNTPWSFGQILDRVLELAKLHGVRTLTNAAPASQNLDPKIFELTDILCVNETEAEIIAGR